MRLKRATQYALQVLIYLNRRGATDPAWVARREIAERLHIPRVFLARVCRQLVRSGLVEVQRGPGGGFRLAPGVDGVSVETILRTLEGPRWSEACILGFPECTDAQWCPLHPLWQSLQEGLTAALRGQTLEDLTREAVRRGLSVTDERAVSRPGEGAKS